MNELKLISIEDQIIKATINILLRSGFTLSVNDGEETTVNRSSNPDLIFAAMKTTDEDYIYAHAPGPIHPTNKFWVYFVYGNDGVEVINNYTVSLDPQMDEINKLIDNYENRVGG